MLKYVLQVSNPNWFATWDPRLGERAVMIRQASGDWGVLTGRWLSSPNERGKWVESTVFAEHTILSFCMN